MAKIKSIIVENNSLVFDIILDPVTESHSKFILPITNSLNINTARAALNSFITTELPNRRNVENIINQLSDKEFP